MPTSDPRLAQLDDPTVQPFLADSFSPADYLNSTLSGQISTNGSTARAAPLADLNTQIQSLLSQLNTNTSRLSSTLTQLSDDIIRSGGRLAYEVEVLKGDANSLAETMQYKTRDDVAFLTSRREHQLDVQEVIVKTENDEPLDRLRQLQLVRSRLDEVIKAFGSAMAWPIAPSELSIASSFISVSAPDAGQNGISQEEKGQEYAEKLRKEINETVGVGDGATSLQAAAERIEELRQLSQIWKGTVEEKARTRLVDNLAKPIEERQKALERTRRSVPSRTQDYRYGDGANAFPEMSYGFLQNLRNLRTDG